MSLLLECRHKGKETFVDSDLLRLNYKKFKFFKEVETLKN